MMRYDEGLFIQFCSCMPVVTLIQFGDAIAAGTCFFSFGSQFVTDTLPIRCRFCAWSAFTCCTAALAPKERTDARPRVAMINLVFIVFTPE